MTVKEYTREQKSIYVPHYMREIWNKIKDQAKEKKCGIGYLLLSAWALANGVKVPEYRNPGEVTRDLANKKKVVGDE